MPDHADVVLAYLKVIRVADRLLAVADELREARARLDVVSNPDRSARDTTAEGRRG